METKKILASKNVILASVIAAVLLVAMVGSASAALCSNAIGGPGSCYCGDTVNGDYTFNANMNCVAGQHGLIIGANDIVIDGQGHKITGAEDADNCSLAGESTPNEVPCGVLIHGKYNNVTVENLEVENFCTGVAIKGQNKLNTATNITIHKCIIHDNGNTTCEWEASTHGIHMVWVSYSDITNNKIYNNTGTGSSCCAGGDGIFLYEGKYINITCNEIYDNRKGGIFIKMKPMYNKIFHNKLWENGGPGAGTTGGIILRCKKTNFNTIAYNNASNNYGDGIYIGGRNNTIRNNIANDNGYAGINMGRSDGSYNNELYDNTVCGNGFYDISVYGPGSGTIGDNNTCTTASDYCDEGTTGCTYDCLPDLTIVDKEEDWVVAGSTYTITYTIKNAGNKEAGASTTSIRIDGTEEATDSVPELTAGASHTSTLGPFAMSGTSDTIMVRADINNTVSETNESNNCLENKLELPDLLIDKKSEEWVDLASMKYNITYTVKNIGDAPANASTTCIKIDGTEVTNDAVPELASGASHTKELGTFTMSGDSDTIEVCADKDNAIAESNETNNCLKNVFEYLADLNITDKFEEWVDLSNKTYNITYTVKNIGDGEANTTNISIFIDGTIKKNVSVPGLNATESNTSTIGPFNLSGKNDTIKVCADINGNVSESDETNNCLENVFEYLSMPDLNITVKSEEWVDLANMKYNVTYTVKNVGDAPANASTICIKIDGTEVTNDTVPELASCASHTKELGTFTMSGDSDTIEVCADKDNAIAERNEDNNCLQNTFVYPSVPDLAIVKKLEVWVASNVTYNTYNITYTVKNVGKGDANESTTSILIDRVEVANDSVGALEEGESYTNTLGPFTMSGENDTVRICADKNNDVAESNEDNNCLENVFEYSWIGCVTEDGTLFRCGNTVTKNCTFNGSMSCPFTDGLKIGANNVTIEGNNSMLDGVECTLDATRSGIYNPGYDDVAIKDLEVKSFCFGIRLRGTSNRIENNTIEKCKIHHNGNATSLVATHGIKMEYVFNSTIRNNSIHDQIAHVDPNPGCEDGGNGIFLYKGDYNLITRNKFYNNTKGGFFMKMMPMYNNISYNELWGNGQGGIILRCMKSNYNLIEHNNMSDNYGSGIFIGGNNNTVRYNTVCNNRNGGPYYEDIGVGGRGYGINIGRSDGSCYNKLYENKVCENDYKDIYIVSGVIGNHGDENTCDTTYNYNGEGTTGCTYNCGGNPGCVAADGTVYRCGDTVMKSCTFNGNMTCPAGKGLVVGADGITIDGAGFTLDGVSPGTCEDFNRAGISGTTMSTRDNVTIKNLKVKNFCCGIYLEGFGALGKFTNVTIDNCTIYDNGVNVTGKKTHGIKMTFVYNSVIKNCEIYNNTGGLGCTPPCENGGSGIFVYAGDYNLITQNAIYNNRKGGYFTKAKPTYTNIINNTLWGNGQGGIVLRCKACEYNLIEHNNASYNYGVGIFIGGPRNTIRNNIASYNKNGSLTGLPGTLHGGGGINIGRSDGSFENELYNNTVCGNEYLDIHVCLECVGNTGDENTCDTTYNYDDTGTTGCTYSCPSIAQVFDTGKGTYPSIFGTHNGKIIPDQDITVNKMYTYPCKGTGGHTEYVRIWNESEGIEGEGNWSGYQGDYHNITISPTITLRKGHEYNYIIRTGSYPQIIHAREYKAEGGNITCEEFIDANGKEYNNWIPAIRLYVE